MPRPTEKCLMTREHVLKFIDAVVYTLGSSGYVPMDLDIAYDEHCRGLVSNLVEAVFLLAEEIGFDLWEEVAAPVGCRDDAPIAVLLRDADDAFGMRRSCPVRGCRERPLRSCLRPASLPAGTRWPSCPELCCRHTELRLDRLERRLGRTALRRRGPIHTCGMPMPAFAHLADPPEQLRLVVVG